MMRAWMSGVACVAFLVASARADDVQTTREGSIVKVDIPNGKVWVKTADNREVEVNLKDLSYLRDRLRYRLAERREGNKVFVTDENGKIIEWPELRGGGKVFYQDKDGKITHFVVPTK
jgi:hypothetical protein